MREAPGKRRGVLFRPHPRGSQRLLGGILGDWWVSDKCALGHRHREKVGPKSLAIEEHHRLRLQVRRKDYCPRLDRSAKPLLFEDAAKEYQEWSEAHKKSHQTDEHWLNRLKLVFAGKTLAEITPGGGRTVQAVLGRGADQGDRQSPPGLSAPPV